MNINFLIFFIMLLLVSGCEKIIDVDLNEANPAIVIEGNLSLSDSKLEVNVSKTDSYFGSDPVRKVTGAVVILENNSGTQIEVEEVDEGLYKNDKVILSSGQDYKLQVKVEGVVYTAFSTLNPVVQIDSLGYEFSQATRFFDGGYRLNLYFSDPAEQENYYRIKVYKNGVLLDGVSNLVVFDDSGINGRAIKVRLGRQTFKDGDRAELVLLSIDKPVWEYFSTLRDVANTNPGSPAPANPISNFDNGALGYFSAWSHDSQTIIIAEQ